MQVSSAVKNAMALAIVAVIEAHGSARFEVRSGMPPAKPDLTGFGNIMGTADITGPWTVTGNVFGFSGLDDPITIMLQAQVGWVRITDGNHDGVLDARATLSDEGTFQFPELQLREGGIVQVSNVEFTIED